MLKNIVRTNPVHRCFATAAATRKSKTKVGLAERPDPHEVSCDYVGPPDPQSNLRPYVRHISKNETPLATRLRLKRDEVEQWNSDFWTKHNKRFYEDKADFIRLHNLSEHDENASDRISVFYKSFLDKNRRIHLLYNVSWYIKNSELLIMALQVEIQNLFRRGKRIMK